MKQKFTTSPLNRYEILKACEKPELTPITKTIGYNPTGSFSHYRDEKLLSKLKPPQKTVARNLAILTGSPVRLAAAWVTAKTNEYSPRDPRNPFLIPKTKHLKLFFTREEEHWKPKNVDEIITTIDDLHTILKQQLQVQLKKLQG